MESFSPIMHRGSFHSIPPILWCVCYLRPHFRLAALRDIGGWDPYNVTEDADLGIRLARFGYRCGCLTLPTYEEAPSAFTHWSNQRSRWLKGWMQTLLVHMREPIKTASEMGWLTFFQFHMVLTSVVLSVLLHPLFLGLFLYKLASLTSGSGPTALDLSIIAIAAFNLVGGYTTYGLLAWAVALAYRLPVHRVWIITLPVYWLLISLAGFRAVYQLVFSPHHWEKTPHGEAERRTPSFSENAWRASIPGPDNSIRYAGRKAPPANPAYAHRPAGRPIGHAPG